MKRVEKVLGDSMKSYAKIFQSLADFTIKFNRSLDVQTCDEIINVLEGNNHEKINFYHKIKKCAKSSKLSTNFLLRGQNRQEAILNRKSTLGNKSKLQTKAIFWRCRRSSCESCPSSNENKFHTLFLF